MDIAHKRILLTGAAGGIGAELARALSARGARLALLGRDVDALRTLSSKLDGEAHAFGVDLLDDTRRVGAVAAVRDALGGIDVLINNAGVVNFGPFAEQDPASLQAMVKINMLVPMLLTQEILPEMVARGSGHVLNVGSTFGSIGFAWFTTYSASKFGLRGFSEALRRELQGTGVGVTYAAPRAVRTALYSDAVYRMAEAVKMNMDSPEWVAAKLVVALQRERKNVFLGFPESLFARLNGVLPWLVDGGLRKQNRQMEVFARGG